MFDAAASIRCALEEADARTTPYRHWLLTDVLPEEAIRAILALPITPADIEDTAGRRETHNSTRRFFAPDEQDRFPVCRALAAAWQEPATIAAIETTCNVDLGGNLLRIEYCQDRDGFWLEPHTDIGAKFFTMLVYLSDPPSGEDWGTDIYASPGEFAGSAPGQRNTGLIFIPGENTWHGFRRRPITGVRRSLIVNYVTPNWLSRHELAFPDHPVA